MSKNASKRFREDSSHRDVRTDVKRANAMRRLTVVIALIASDLAVAASGDVLRLGTVAAPATFIEAKTGVSYQLFFEAIEMNGGAGHTTIRLGGGGLAACSVHGPGVDSFLGSDFNYSGNSPFGAIQCGTAYGQRVAVSGCTAAVQAHGFMHADAPNVTLLGSTSIDFEFQKGKNGNRASISLNGVQLTGTVTAGAITMATCP